MTNLLRLAFGFMVVLSAVACGGDRALQPVTPSPATGAAQPAPVPAASRVSGTVFERTPQATRALAGANVSAWVDLGTRGYSYMFANGPLLTDPEGRFQLRNLPDEAKVTLQVWKEGYVQQCAAAPVPPNASATLEVHLVARASVSASPSSVPPSTPGSRFVSGVIYQSVGSGRQPIAGVFVAYEPLMDFPAAVTYSDSEGRYLLCGLPDAASVQIGAAVNPQRVGWITVPPGQTTGADIVLP